MNNEKAIAILSMNKVISRGQKEYVEAVEVGIQALTKQEPVKMLGHTPFGSCPNCKYDFSRELINDYRILHCPKCGQRICD